jgi:hypothetical protein
MAERNITIALKGGLTSCFFEIRTITCIVPVKYNGDMNTMMHIIVIKWTNHTYNLCVIKFVSDLRQVGGFLRT